MTSLKHLGRRERLLRVFENRIYDGNFTELSGWDHPVVPLHCTEQRIVIPEEFLARYVYDREQKHTALVDSKITIRKHLSEREGTSVDDSSFICVPGSTAALTLAIHLVKRKGVETVISDVPYYFSTERVSSAVGLKFMPVRRSAETLRDPQILFDAVRRPSTQKRAIVVTQPRYVLSEDYTADFLHELLSLLGPNDFLILDQATDMIYQNGNTLPADGRVLKIRSLGKALSANGARLAVILGDRKLIPELNATAGFLFGSLDIAMLLLGTALVQNSDTFRRQLAAVLQHAQNCAFTAQAQVERDGLKLIPPANGFLGHIRIDLAKIPRFSLYQHLLRHDVNALFSEQFGMLRPERYEMLRVNFLLDTRRAMDILSSYVTSLQAHPE
jgi:aspartate/methionine/tyrosine aminotransferase